MPRTSRPPAAPFGVVAAVLVASWAGITAAESDSLFDIPASAARSRLRVAPGNAAETDIRDCLQNAVDAANAEDLDGFVNCFAGSAKAKIRKPAALRFVQHDVSMELVDSQILKVGRVSGEAVVRYRIALSDDRFDVVSLVVLKQEGGYWRIKSEQIQSYSHESPRLCSPSRYACLGGTCQFAAVR